MCPERVVGSYLVMFATRVSGQQVSCSLGGLVGVKYSMHRLKYTYVGVLAPHIEPKNVALVLNSVKSTPVALVIHWVNQIYPKAVVR